MEIISERKSTRMRTACAWTMASNQVALWNKLSRSDAFAWPGRTSSPTPTHARTPLLFPQARPWADEPKRTGKRKRTNDGDEQDGPPPRRMRESLCPTEGCSTRGRRIRLHVYKHFPECMCPRTLDGPSGNDLALRRVAVLRRLAEFLTGVPRLENLCCLLDEQWHDPVGEVTPPIVEEILDLSCRMMWNCPTPITLKPISAPGALLHWRPFAFLFSLLSSEPRRRSSFASPLPSPPNPAWRRRNRKRRHRTGSGHASAAQGAPAAARTPARDRGADSTASSRPTATVPNQGDQTPRDVPAARGVSRVHQYVASPQLTNFVQPSWNHQDPLSLSGPLGSHAQGLVDLPTMRNMRGVWAKWRSLREVPLAKGQIGRVSLCLLRAQLMQLMGLSVTLWHRLWEKSPLSRVHQYVASPQLTKFVQPSWNHQDPLSLSGPSSSHAQGLVDLPTMRNMRGVWTVWGKWRSLGEVHLAKWQIGRVSLCLLKSPVDAIDGTVSHPVTQDEYV